MRRHEFLHGLNAGGIDPEAVARVDLEKARIAAEHPMSNLLPRVLGPATLRPATKNLSRVTGDAVTRMIRFSRASSSSYLLLLSANEMRVISSEAIQQVPTVSTTISSGAWSNVSTGAASVTTGATLSFQATSTDNAKARQTLTIAGGDQGQSNILRVSVQTGPVYMRVGTAAGGQEVLAETRLDSGVHKISIVPNTGTVYLELRSDEPVTRFVDQIQFESGLLGASRDFVLPTPWGSADLAKLRMWQSIDVLFVGDGVHQQYEIQHRGFLSWSVVKHATSAGPFIQGSSSIGMTPGALIGNTTMASSLPYFSSNHVGALIEVTQSNKTVQQTFNASGQTSDYITVVGVDSGRVFYRTGVGSSFVGTIVLERSFDPDEPVIWSTYASFVDGATTTPRDDVVDDLNNLRVHYRFRTTAYTSGSATMTLEYEAGIQVGRARITGFTNTQLVNVEVIRAFGNTSASRNWRIGNWSTMRGWPRVPILHDARLHWFRSDTDFASVPDDYTNFDDEEIGDSAPLTRSVGAGGSDGVLWAVSLGKLLVGTFSSESVISASELDEPLTPSKYTVRPASSRGCADIEPAAHDDGAFFVQRSGRRLYEIGGGDNGRFRSVDVSRINPAAYRAGIARIVVQQQPDTRCYALLVDGSVSVLTYERDDKVAAITTIGIDGATIEDICAIPAADQDDVYLIVNRNGGQRFLEKFAKEAEQTSVSTCALLDGHKVLTGSISSITGATHYANQTVQVWADGQRRADCAINGSGVGSLGATYSRVVYGKRFMATFKSAKAAFAAALGTAVGQTKTIHGMGLVLHKSCLDGITVGRDATHLEPLPAIVNGAERTANQFFEHYDQEVFPIDSEWIADARVHISIDSAEGPVTLQGLVLDVETRDGAASGN